MIVVAAAHIIKSMETIITIQIDLFIIVYLLQINLPNKLPNRQATMYKNAQSGQLSFGVFHVLCCRVDVIFPFFFTYRDRLIQLLALKPFKKPEIYARINSGMYGFIKSCFLVLVF